MELFRRKIGPVFLKEDSDAGVFVEKMQELLEVAPNELKEEIDRQIKIATYGVQGENNIAFELKNSGIDMYVLHDLYLECGDLSAQIDYIVITKKKVYVLECKNLIGNIDIDSEGNFVRNYEINGKKIKEGVYSPITQNERHLRVIKEIRNQAQTNILAKILFEKGFDNSYKSLVVLANPKTYLNDRYAKKEVKNQVIRADQLVNKIKALDAESKDADWTNDQMKGLAELLLAANSPNKSDYYQKYEELVEAKNKSQVAPVKPASEEKICPKCGSKLVMRTAKNGDFAGNKFWGCTAFPKCKFIENIV